MKLLVVTLAGTLFALAAGPVQADSHLVGTWSAVEGAPRGARAGTSDHNQVSQHAYNEEADLDWTLTIEEMKGHAFHAQWCSQHMCEDAVGTLRRDGETILMADEDGAFIGTLMDDQMELCYLEAGKDFRIVDCHFLEKK